MDPDPPKKSATSWPRRVEFATIPGGYTQNYTWGRLSAVVFQGQTPFGFDLDFAYEYSYNQAGRVTGNRMLANGGGMQVFDLQAQYGWDNQGRMNSMTYPWGPVMSYTFDAMGRPTGMSETACILPGGQTCTAQSWGAVRDLWLRRPDPYAGRQRPPRHWRLPRHSV